jgi:hypothetical protein
MISKFKINFEHPEAERGGFDVELQQWRQFSEAEKELLMSVAKQEAEVEINTDTGIITIVVRM